MEYHRSVKKSLSQLSLLFFSLLLVQTSAHADMAVLIQVTQNTVQLERVQRSESAEFESSADEDVAQIMNEQAQPKEERLDADRSALSDLLENNDKLVVYWFNANGKLVGRELLRDPRFVHAPGSKEVILPEATLLLRAPNEAVLMRIKPREFAQFIDLNV